MTVFLLSLLSAGDADKREDLAARIYRELLALRQSEGLSDLPRTPALDRVAARRAVSIAARPAERRLPPKEPLARLLRDEESLRGRKLVEQIDVQRETGNPVEATRRAWLNHTPYWDLLIEERFEALGLGVGRAEDGSLVIVTVFLEGRSVPTDLATLEERTEREVNRIRSEHGLPALTTLPALRDVARRHSEDMARRGFFDHASPEGSTAGDRVLAFGLPYRMVGENIGKSMEMEDPVVTIVDGWLHSPGHRANLLHPRYRRTGVGIAISEDGVIYFTQLFVQPTGRQGEVRSP